MFFSALRRVRFVDLLTLPSLFFSTLEKVPGIDSSMDDLWKLSIGQNAPLVILTFLQADCRISDYDEELRDLGKGLTRDNNCNGSCRDSEDNGDLETDGHLPVCISVSLDDIQPSVQLHRPGEPLTE